MTAAAYDLTPVVGALRPLDAARALGLTVAPGGQRDRVRVSCPWHAEKHPSCVLTWKSDRTVAFCQSCQQGGDVFELYAAVHGLHPKRDFRRIARAVADFGGVRLDHGSAPFAPRKATDPVLELALVIDDAADQWLRGYGTDEEPGRWLRAADAAILGAASASDVVTAMRMLADIDPDRAAIARDIVWTDAALDFLADAFESDARERAAIEAE